MTSDWLAACLLGGFLLVVTGMCAEARGADSIAVREHVIFDGNRGWEREGVTYRLACAVYVAEAPDGSLVAAWLTGSNKEPATDNCIVVARSTDGGHTWSEPAIVVPAGEMMGAHSALHATDDGRLILIAAYLPAEKHYTEWHYFRRESRDNGLTWGPMIPLAPVPEANAAYEKPRRISTGEYVYAGQHFRRRERPLVAPPEDLARARTEDEALAMPASEGRSASKFATHRHGACVFISRRNDGEDVTMSEVVENRPLGLLEPTVIELRDGRLVMLMRAEWGGFLWRAESRDHGRTWSDARQTDIPNPTSKTQLIRLPDGRIALIHNNSGGEVGKRGRRDPLSIWLSDDEMESWYLKQDVIAGGMLAYPDAIILDGKLVFVYDHNRREARFVEVDLPAARR